jgi:hypothetical protein
LEELEDHGLVAPNLTPHQRDLALEWLSERIRQADWKIASSDLARKLVQAKWKSPHPAIEAEAHKTKGSGWCAHQSRICFIFRARLSVFAQAASKPTAGGRTMRFENQAVLVSGAGRGIGKEIALSFAREGADISPENAENWRLTGGAR